MKSIGNMGATNRLLGGSGSLPEFSALESSRFVGWPEMVNVVDVECEAHFVRVLSGPSPVWEDLELANVSVGGGVSGAPQAAFMDVFGCKELVNIHARRNGHWELAQPRCSSIWSWFAWIEG